MTKTPLKLVTVIWRGKKDRIEVGTITQSDLLYAAPYSKSNLERAEHLVLCWNSHDALLEALEKAGEYFEQRADIDNEKDGNEEMSLLVEIEAAIKKARL